jgi:hypothetical protein
LQLETIKHVVIRYTSTETSVSAPWSLFGRVFETGAVRDSHAACCPFEIDGPPHAGETAHDIAAVM